MTDDDLMATCVADEAANQPYEGKVCVAIVVRNRMRLHYASDGTVAGTVLAPNQFSGFWYEMVNGHYTKVAHTLDEAEARAQDKFERYSANGDLWDECQNAVMDSYNWERGGHLTFEPGPAFAGITQKTVLYYNPEITDHTPAWASPDKQDAVIFDHTFFHA